jgi:hypothetical protein
MEMRKPVSPERADELTNIARNRPPREQLPFKTGPELIGLGLGLLLLAAIVGGLLMAATQGTGSAPLALVVWSLGGLVGLVMMIAGIIRWAVEPLIYFQQLRAARRKRKRVKGNRKKRPKNETGDGLL